MAEEGVINKENQGLSGHFRSVDGVPLDQRMSIAVGPDNDRSIHAPVNIGREEMTNFQRILETGRVDADGITGNRNDIAGNRQYIDWESDDAYTRAVDQVTENVTAVIQEDILMQNLLEQDSWDMDDRMMWESRLSQITSQELAEIPGLRDYRRIPDGPFQSPGEEADPLESARERVTRLNDLSSDIENGTGNIEFDCEAMAITEGAIMQRIENTHLPESAADGNYMQSSNYFFTGGLVMNADDRANVDVGGHAYIVSSATGGVIEATYTNGGSEYIMPREGFSFEDFASGAPFTARGTSTNSVYTGTDTDFLGDPVLGKIRDIEGLKSVSGHLAESVEEFKQNPHLQELEKLQEVAAEKGSIDPDLAEAYQYHFSEIYPDLLDLQEQADWLEESIDRTLEGNNYSPRIEETPTEADTMAHALYDIKGQSYGLRDIPSARRIEEMVQNGETLDEGSLPTLHESVSEKIDSTLDRLNEQFPDTVGPVIDQHTLKPLVLNDGTELKF